MKSVPVSCHSWAGLAAVLALVTAGPAAAATYFYDFESGSALPWAGDSDPGITTPSLGVVGGDNYCPTGGTRYLGLKAGAYSAPNQGEWAYTRYPVAAGTYTVTVRYVIRNKVNCSTCQAMVFASNTSPGSSGAFALQGPVGAVWTGYSFTTTVTATSGFIGVAVGWWGTADNPASGTLVGLDCVYVSII